MSHWLGSFLCCALGRESPWAEWRNRKAAGQGWAAWSWRKCGWGPKGSARSGEGSHKEEGCRGNKELTQAKLFNWSSDLHFLILWHLFTRKSTETRCQPPAFSSRSWGCVRFALLTWGSMTTTDVWQIILVGSSTWALSRSERNWTNLRY